MFEVLVISDTAVSHSCFSPVAAWFEKRVSCPNSSHQLHDDIKEWEILPVTTISKVLEPRLEYRKSKTNEYIIK
jgi:hypothetical protein